MRGFSLLFCDNGPEKPCIAWVKTKNLERGVDVVRAKRAIRQRRKFLNVISQMQEARQTLELYICVRFGMQSILRIRVIWDA